MIAYFFLISLATLSFYLFPSFLYRLLGFLLIFQVSLKSNTASYVHMAQELLVLEWNGKRRLNSHWGPYCDKNKKKTDQKCLISINCPIGSLEPESLAADGYIFLNIFKSDIKWERIVVEILIVLTYTRKDILFEFKRLLEF